MGKREEIISANTILAQRLLKEAELKIEGQTEGLEIAKKQVFKKSLKDSLHKDQEDLIGLYELIIKLEIMEGATAYQITYENKVINSGEAYKTCIKNYIADIKMLGIEEKKVFEFCRPIVKELIRTLPKIAYNGE